MSQHGTGRISLLHIIISSFLVIFVLAVAFLLFMQLKKQTQKEKPAAASEASTEIITMDYEDASGEEDGIYIIKGNDKSSNPYERADKLSYTDSVKYTLEDLEQLDSYGLRITRNEVYARHGRMFVDQDLQTYFDRQDWYVASVSPSDFDDDELNEVEMYNVQLILDYEME